MLPSRLSQSPQSGYKKKFIKLDNRRVLERVFERNFPAFSVRLTSEQCRKNTLSVCTRQLGKKNRVDRIEQMRTKQTKQIQQNRNIQTTTKTTAVSRFQTLLSRCSISFSPADTTDRQTQLITRKKNYKLHRISNKCLCIHLHQQINSLIRLKRNPKQANKTLKHILIASIRLSIDSLSLFVCLFKLQIKLQQRLQHFACLPSSSAFPPSSSSVNVKCSLKRKVSLTSAAVTRAAIIQTREVFACASIRMINIVMLLLLLLQLLRST